MHTDDEVIADPHVAARNMLVEMPRTDGVEPAGPRPRQPGEAVEVAEGPETRVPWLGEHTDEVLPTSSASTTTSSTQLAADGVITDSAASAPAP